MRLSVSNSLLTTLVTISCTQADQQLLLKEISRHLEPTRCQARLYGLNSPPWR